MCDENRRGKEERRKKKTTWVKYNGLPYWAAINREVSATAAAPQLYRTPHLYVWQTSIDDGCWRASRYILYSGESESWRSYMQFLMGVPKATARSSRPVYQLHYRLCAYEADWSVDKRLTMYCCFFLWKTEAVIPNIPKGLTLGLLCRALVLGLFSSALFNCQPFLTATMVRAGAYPGVYTILSKSYCVQITAYSFV